MEIKTDIEFTKIIKAPDVYTETQTEYVLPDYNGDVRKILFTSADVRPSGKFAGTDEIEFSGIVVYNVVYSDSENNISSTSFTSDYDYSVKYSAEKYKDSFADTRIANFAIRLIGPRKISAKASVAGSVRIAEHGEMTVSGSAFSGDEKPEVRSRTVRMRSTTASETVEREYAESLSRLDGAIADEVSVIYSEAEAIADEVTAGVGEVTVKGQLRLSAVIKNADEPAYLLEKILPIEETVPFESVSEDMSFVPELVVSSLNATVNADETGSEVVLSAIVDFSVVGERNEQMEMLADAYMKSCATENTYEDFNYGELAALVVENGTQNAAITRAEFETDRLREVIFLSALPKIESVESSGKGAKIVGEIRYSGIASELCDDGSVSYNPIKFSAPFEENVNINCQNCENLKLEAKAKAYSAGASVDASKLYASCILQLCVTATNDKCERRLSCSEARTESPYELHPARVVVYYPDANDTLFSVAKRFHTTPLKVALDNSLDVAVSSGSNAETSLKNVKNLLIY